ncbi:MAG: hypothetical protein AM326_02140 [Candidatus Thorarchaeota archaeon SMTZ-45]|nr:MAG: hypothetical protein AM325_01115 [Candidatus Thorarchaeota archaeon SMTZ1-45]KXH76711.1 MAG: hypothetical protein AM326_02140 [Candidatus Thorarchaeota archaeon SMTZ-45]
MAITLRTAVIDSVEETETRRLKLLKVSSKSDGAMLTLELPDALSDTLNTSDSITVVIDSKPITKGEQAKLYIEGSVFKKSEKNGLEVVGSVGGLRLVFSLTKSTPSQSNVFSSEKFFLAIM